MCYTTKGWPRKWCKRPSSSSAGRHLTTGSTGARCEDGYSPWFQLPPQYDTVDQSLTVLTVDRALDKLLSIYGDVMRLVRDGFTHSEIAERLGIPIGTVKSRMAKAADTLRAELASLRSGGNDAF